MYSRLKRETRWDCKTADVEEGIYELLRLNLATLRVAILNDLFKSFFEM
jgi:hypothetical protein